MWGREEKRGVFGPHVIYIAVIALICAAPLIAEEIRLTTYYPSPFGEYDMLMANTLEVDGETLLAVSAGDVGIGTTTPNLLLDVLSSDQGYPIAIGAGSQTKGVARFETTQDILLDLGTADASPWGFWLQAHNTANSAAFPILLNPNGGNVGIGTTTPSSTLEVAGWIGRTAHNNGGLVGSYVNVGANSTRTNPIYAIGSSYLPNDSTLGNMYGIGYTHTNASFITDPGPNSWGMYVAANGDARIWLAATAGGVSYFNAGNVGIGTTTPAHDFHVHADLAYNGTALIDGTNRTGLMLTGTYPHLVIGSSVSNSNHAGTLSFWHNNAGGGTTTQWNMGASDNGFSIGYTTNNFNPHAGLNDWTVPSFFHIESNGNVGIGTTNPSGRLHAIEQGGIGAPTSPNWDQAALTVSNTANTLRLALDGNQIVGSGETALQTSAGAIRLEANTNDNQIYLATDGKVGIGTAVPNFFSRLTVAAEPTSTALGAPREIAIYSSANFPGVGTVAAGFVDITPNASVMGRHTMTAVMGEFDAATRKVTGIIASYDNVNDKYAGVLGRAPNQIWVVPLGGWRNSYAGLFLGNVRIEPGPNGAAGNLWAAGAIAAVGGVSSDRSLKTGIEPFMGGFEKLAGLEAVRYKWKDELDPAQNEHIGFVAQDVEAQFPEVVLTGGDGLKGIEYWGIVAALVNTVKEQQGRIRAQGEHQERQLEELEKLKEDIKKLKMGRP